MTHFALSQDKPLLQLSEDCLAGDRRQSAGDHAQRFAARLMVNDGIRKRVAELKEAQSQKSELSRDQVREFLTEMILTPAGKVDEQSRLCQSYKGYGGGSINSNARQAPGRRAAFHRHFDLNVLGLILVTQEALKHFGSDGGSIVNLSSIVSTSSPAGTAVYNATKSAVDGLTRSFAKELGPRNIRVNSINPGPIETEGVHAVGFIERFRSLAATIPLGRIGQPNDIAPGVVFLASPDSAWMTGETLYITGGLR